MTPSLPRKRSTTELRGHAVRIMFVEIFLDSYTNFPHLNLLERETGFEPATNSLEGYDSTTELLPLSIQNFNYLYF